MTHHAATAKKGNERPLQNIRLRLVGWLVFRAVVLVPLGCFTVVAATMAADAALDLSDAIRAGIPTLLVVCGVVAFLAIALQARRLGTERVARLYERLFPTLGNRLSNAVQLANIESGEATSEFLRLEALELGRQSARTLSVWPVLKRGTLLLLAILAVPGLVCVTLLFAICGSGVMDVLAPRFMDPHGDHPPYSRLRIDVVPKNASVLYAGEVEIRATASGRPVDKLWLVARSGTNESRTIMFLAPDRSFFQSLANLREPVEYYVTDGVARSFRQPIQIRYTPQMTMVELTTQYPDYTSKPSRTAKLTDETQTQALPVETKIAFRVASNRPLKSGDLILTPVLGGKAVTVTLTNEPQNTIVSGSFTLTEPVVFTLTVRDMDGLKSADARQGRFNILPDERPRLFVLEPGRDAVATPAIRIPVRVQADDDYGVSRVVWLRGHNRSIEQTFNMKLTLRNGARSVEAAGAFDLEKLGVRPGDLIEYYFEAADNDPKGPNLTVSKLYRLQIISKEQYEAILRQAAARKALFEPYMALDNWLKRLAERSRNLDGKLKNGTDAEKKAAQEEAIALSQDLAKYHEQLSKLLGQAVMFDVEASFRNTLVEEETRIGILSAELKQATSTGSLTASKMSEISDKLSELSKTEEEEVGEPALQIASVANILARSDVFVRLANEQATLVRLLRRLGEKTDGLSRIEQMEVQELAHQQRRIQQQLGDMMASLPGLLDQLPPDAGYDPLRKEVNDFMKAITDARIANDLADASKSLGEMDASAGYVMAKSASEKMEKLIDSCQSLPQQGKQVLCTKFKPSRIGESLEQILAAMGAGQGKGDQSTRDGYSMFKNDVGLYGPEMERAGEQAGGRGGETRDPGNRRVERLSNDASSPGVKAPDAPGRVRLQVDAKFPLRYRELVGDYFRVIAESESEEK